MTDRPPSDEADVGMAAREASGSWSLPLSFAAIVASAVHIAIDFAADVYPRDALGYALVGVTGLVLYVLWIRALGLVRSGSDGAIKFASIAALIQAGLANGLVGFFPCPPVALWGGDAPCAFAPWQDLAHLGSFIFGVAAFIVLRRDPVTAPRADRQLMLSGFMVLFIHIGLSWVVAATR